MIDNLNIPPNILNTEKNLNFDLYHGTSTIFLNSIENYGLGGVNPVNEWKILELSKEVFILSEKYLKDSDLFNAKSKSYEMMIAQSSNGSFNFQHGDTYITPSKETAIRYAISNTFGSELLSRTIEFLKKLLDLKIQYATKDLFRKFPKIFGLIEANPSPVLIKIKNVPPEILTNEHGEPPLENYNRISEILSTYPEIADTALQQTNFRLNSPISKKNHGKFLIVVTKWDPFKPEYNLYSIDRTNI